MEEPLDSNEETSDLLRVRYILKKMVINLKKFYEFFTNVMNCSEIFNEYLFYGKNNTTTPFIEEDIFCSICMERKNSVILECYVN